MIDAAIGVVLFVVNLALLVCMPPVAQCPPNWWLGEGVRRTGPDVGSFACYAPLAKCCGEPAGIVCEKPCPDVEIRRSRIYCTGGAKPIVVDFRTVGCQR